MWGLASATAKPTALSSDSIRYILPTVSAMTTAPTPTIAGAKARSGPRARLIKRGCECILPWSAPAQHAGGVTAVIDDDGGRIRILRLAAQPCRGAAGCGKRPGRVVGLLDRRFAAAARSDDGGVAGPGELDAFKADGADRGCAVLQVDDGLATLGQDIERGAAHADGRQRRRDLVGGLVRMAGDETKRARRHAHRDFAIVMLVVEDGAVELERRVGSEREVGAVGHHQPRCAVDPGAHGLVADQSITDPDLDSRRSGNTEHFILD